MSISRSQYEGIAKGVRYDVALMKGARSYLLKALGNVMEARGKILGGVGGMSAGGIDFRSPNVDLETLYEQIDKATKRLEEAIAIWEKNLTELGKEVK